MTHAISRLATALVAAAALAALLATPASAVSPTVTTEAATDKSANSAKLNATIDTHGYYTKYAFEWGETTEYGNYTLTGEIKAGETDPVQVSATLENLSLETNYHFRILAIVWEAGGEGSIGDDLSFETLSGLYVAGEESEAEEDQPRITSTLGSASTFAELSPATVFNVFSTASTGPVECQSGGGYAGKIGSSKPTSSFSLSMMAFSECEFEGGSASVAMNGCEYAYSVANAGPPYVGAIDEISCPSGKAIEVSIPSICTLKIPSQTLEGTASFANSNYEEEEISAVEVDAAASGLSYEKVSGLYCGVFTGSGELGGSMKLFSVS